MDRWPVLNWYGDDPALIEGLVERIEQGGTLEAQIRTIRLGVKWANLLTPGDVVIISIMNDQQIPHTIGYARVRKVQKGIFSELQDAEESLAANIGAKTWGRVLKDMQSVYGSGEDGVGPDSVISIIDLEPQKIARKLTVPAS